MLPIAMETGASIYLLYHVMPEPVHKAVRTVTAGQSLGQKNTVFAIWMGYTFMTPETAIVGGLYSIWHNIYNSWQLYRGGKKETI